MARLRSTHCGKGHLFDEENTYWYKDTRQCRACNRLRNEKYNRRLGYKPRPAPQISDDPSHLAYAAGIVDGEGSIGIRYLHKVGVKEKKYHGLNVRVTSTAPELINWLKEHFGGSVTIRTRSNALNQAAYSNWYLLSRHADAFLKAIRPYMIVKGPQADLATELQSTMQNGAVRLTPELIARREEIRHEIMRLNRQRRLTEVDPDDSAPLE